MSGVGDGELERRSADIEEGRKCKNDVRRPLWARSLENGLEVLSHFENERVLLGAAEAADLTGLSRQTAHKCLVTLSALGYLIQTPSRHYRLAEIDQRIAVRRGEHGLGHGLG
jgi:Fic family protein